MGLAKGRAFSAILFRWALSRQSIPAKSQWKVPVCTFFRFTRNLLFIVSVGSENILSRKLHVSLKE